MFKIIDAILNLFDEGAAQGDASANIPADTQQDSGDLSNVKYGKQPDSQSGTPDGKKQDTDAKAPDTTDVKEPPVNKDSAFHDLIRGEYKISMKLPFRRSSISVSLKQRAWRIRSLKQSHLFKA